MRYFGSKTSTLHAVGELICARLSSGSFCDPFGGTGIVGSFFKARGFQVWSGDVLLFAHYFQVARIQLNALPKFPFLCKTMDSDSDRRVVDILNTIPQADGWFTREYARQRMFFTPMNASRIESCWIQIEEWADRRLIDDDEHKLLLASLINSMDAVANTAGTYYAYLKNYHRKSRVPFRFKLLRPTCGIRACYSIYGDAHNLVSSQAFDVLYLDPPYNRRSYAHYYHLPETVAQGSPVPVHGKSGIPNKVGPSSAFNRYSEVSKALKALLDASRFRLLAFHYSDAALLPPKEVHNLLSSYGRVEKFTLRGKGYTTVPAHRTTDHALYLVSRA
jgi:adenine-specific DNA-methyltransferase